VAARDLRNLLRGRCDRPKLTGSGGVVRGRKIEQCGWLKDRYGLFWQIAPTVLGDMMKDSDRARAKRVAEAMLKMVKLDIEGLKKAYEGRSP
jgi:predicted 3-demethylubiquinone-9 3-methyltransferase (glyoxalase superfamily)